jgi:hypothetical protein
LTDWEAVIMPQKVISTASMARPNGPIPLLEIALIEATPASMVAEAV